MTRLGLLLSVALAAVQPGVAADAGRSGEFASCATALLCGRGATASARLNATVTRPRRELGAAGGDGVPLRRGRAISKALGLKRASSRNCVGARGAGAFSGTVCARNQALQATQSHRVHSLPWPW